MRAKQIIFLFVLILLVILLVPFLFPSSFPGVNRMVGTLGTKVGSLTVSGVAPQVIQIYIKDGAGPWQALSSSISGPGILALADNTKNIEVMATVYDINGDCNNFNTANQYAYICAAIPGGPPNCNAAAATRTLNGVSITGPINDLCNFTFTSTFPLEYWRRWGDWPINVTIQDTDSLNNNTRQYWYYTPTAGLEYPYPIVPEILFGSVDAGAWNPGRPTAGNSLKNTGNIRVNMTWNATNFTANPPGTDIIPTGVNFCVDRDQTRSGGTYAEQCMDNDNLVPVWYQPTGGVRRCGIDACTADEDGAPNEATYLKYWHINVPSGVGSGQYNNTIQYNGYAYTGAG